MPNLSMFQCIQVRHHTNLSALLSLTHTLCSWACRLSSIPLLLLLDEGSPCSIGTAGVGIYERCAMKDILHEMVKHVRNHFVFEFGLYHVDLERCHQHMCSKVVLHAPATGEARVQFSAHVHLRITPLFCQISQDPDDFTFSPEHAQYSTPRLYPFQAGKEAGSAVACAIRCNISFGC